MRGLCVLLLTVALMFTLASMSAAVTQVDTIETESGELAITHVGHGSLFFNFNGKVIHIDPYGKLANYEDFPDADIILITHEHRDHLDLDTIEKIRKDGTVIICNRGTKDQLPDALVMLNGDKKTVFDITIEAVAAYNLVHMRSEGVPYHARGNHNGYIITFSDKRIYVAGDTENVPEMKELDDIDIAFLPMNLPYTMTPEMTAAAARMIMPRILYPYHYGSTNTEELTDLLKGSGIEVRVKSGKK